MKLLISGSALGVLALSGASLAGGLDRTGQPVDILFEKGGESGGHLRMDIARSYPNVTGTGAGVVTPPGLPDLPAGTEYDNVAEMITSISGAVKFQLNDQLAFALIAEEPYGSDLVYQGNNWNSEFGGTRAWAETYSLTALLHYRLDEHWSLHGGLRYQQIEGDIRLSGWAYGTPRDVFPVTANGYEVTLGKDSALGYVLGASYEIPEIALRATLTYNSTITHEMDTMETGNPLPYLDGRSTTEVKTPQSVNLDLQTGIAADTLLFGSVRWVKWSEFRIDPDGFDSIPEAIGGGIGLVELDDTVTYSLGIARRFSDAWSGSFEGFYEPREDGVVAPLFPAVGFWGGELGVRRDFDDVSVSMAVRYTALGDGRVETYPVGVAKAQFEDNDVLSVGFRIGYDF